MYIVSGLLTCGVGYLVGHYWGWTKGYMTGVDDLVERTKDSYPNVLLHAAVILRRGDK